MDLKLELITVPVSDVDRAKAFYVDQVGFNADHDHRVTDDLRFVQLTPPGSACSISIGTGLTEAKPGSAAEVSPIQDLDWGSFVFFTDPDGNPWAVQQIVPRGR